MANATITPEAYIQLSDIVTPAVMLVCNTFIGKIVEATIMYFYLADI